MGYYIGKRLLQIIPVLLLVSIPRFSRIARAAVLQKMSLDYVQAARALGKRHWAILTSDILPNCLSPIIVQATLTLPSAILGEAALSFLGLGTPASGPLLGPHAKRGSGLHGDKSGVGHLPRSGHLPHRTWL